ncbi:uncharacterized protein LOC141850262 [Brevipalpus obovatus]|uniref:uncharacterized protein LOC141850262 n=1 Tax=Brevipalpus obovatus TaxID=246614 RepID=UPI003D9DBC6F
MIKSIVLLASLLAVVAAHPQGLLEMPDDDPNLPLFTSDAFKIYSSGSKNKEELVKFSNARTTHQQDRMEFDLEVKKQQCMVSYCFEYTVIVHVNGILQRSSAGYLYTFSEGPAMNIKEINKRSN